MTSGEFKVTAGSENTIGEIGIPVRRGDGSVLSQVNNYHTNELLWLSNSNKINNNEYVMIHNLTNCYPKQCHLQATYTLGSPSVGAAETYHKATRSVDVKPTPRDSGDVRVGADAYDAEYLGSDRVTQGADWQSKYGQDGYFMFAYNPDGSNLVSLPSYVSSITAHVAHSSVDSGLHWDPANYAYNPSVALTQPGGNTTALGAYTTVNPNACQQSLVVDVTLTDPVNSTEPITFSIYAVDIGSEQRIQVLEIFDLETKNIISPFQTMSEFQNGVWFSWKYNKSFRIRMAYVRANEDAVQAVLSGFFFGDLL